MRGTSFTLSGISFNIKLPWNDVVKRYSAKHRAGGFLHKRTVCLLGEQNSDLEKQRETSAKNNGRRTQIHYLGAEDVCHR